MKYVGPFFSYDTIIEQNYDYSYQTFLIRRLVIWDVNKTSSTLAY